MTMSSHANRPLVIHTHTSGEQGLFANAYLIETAHGVVAVDGTLTRSESRAFRRLFETLEKPLLAVLVTHAHPDHVAGITELVQGKDVPIVALASVKRLMEQTEQAKHAQWGPVYQDEWIRAWTYPNHLVEDRETTTFDGIMYRVYDLGPGGDCNANAIWVVEVEPRVAFVGDLIFHGMHSYVADTHLLDWLINLERARSFLRGVETLYLGHGAPGGIELLHQQRDYLLTYCEAIKDLAGSQTTLSEQGKEELVRRMQRLYPDAGLTFMIRLGADAVAAELAGHPERKRRETAISDGKHIARTFYQTVDAIGAGQTEIDAFDEIAANTFQAHLPGGPTVDREGFKAVVQAFGVGFPNATHSIAEVIADEKLVAIRIIWRGKHTGIFQGAPATNKDIEMSEMGVMRIEDGKVVEFWPLFDSITLMMGAGIVKP